MVPTAQPLGTLAVTMLEPRSEDGLATWNFFDDELQPGHDYPVTRLQKPVPIALTAAAPFRKTSGRRGRSRSTLRVSVAAAACAGDSPAHRVAGRRTLAGGEGRPPHEGQRGNRPRAAVC